MHAFPELFWLTLTALFTATLWVPYIVNRIVEHGLWPALRNPNHDVRPVAPWADRLMWAHVNAVENLVVFAPLALAVHILGAGTTTTATAAAVYFFARVVHAAVYTLGVAFVRTLAFFVGFVAQILLGLAVVLALGFG